VIALPERLTPPDAIDVRPRVAARARDLLRGDATEAAWVFFGAFDASNAITSTRRRPGCG